MDTVERNFAQNRFQIENNGQTAVAEFVLDEPKIIVTHVIVPVSWRGRGVASQLAAEVVIYAREKSWKIVPQCPFMAAYMARHPEEADLLA